MPEEPNQPQPPQPLTPYDFLKTIPGAPSPNEIEAFKAQAPAGRMKLFTTDGTGKRVFIIRAISGLEMETINRQIPEGSTNQVLDMQIGACVKCVVWTNTTQDGLTDELYWRRTTAGLAPTVFMAISKLSDFNDPESLEILSADL